MVAQGDALNRSRLATAVCVPLTRNLRCADAPGNVLLTASMTGLPKDSAANATRIIALDRSLLEERTGQNSSAKLDLLLAGIDTVFGRQDRRPLLRMIASPRGNGTARRAGGRVAQARTVGFAMSSMSVATWTLIDTNELVHRYDGPFPDKQRIATEAP